MRILKDWFESFLIAIVALFILYFTFWPFEINGTSMEDSLMSNDRIVISRVLPHLSHLNRGDIVVVNINEKGKNLKIVKRIVGLPTEKVRIENGNVYINDILLNENFTKNILNDNMADLKLLNGEYFVMGDNRKDSYDSRDFGAVDKKDVVGIVMFKWFPKFVLF